MVHDGGVRRLFVFHPVEHRRTLLRHRDLRGDGLHAALDVTQPGQIERANGTSELGRVRYDVERLAGVEGRDCRGDGMGWEVMGGGGGGVRVRVWVTSRGRGWRALDWKRKGGRVGVKGVMMRGYMCGWVEEWVLKG